MNFLQPAYLWALSALAVPLAIHLLSRKEGKVLRMGSLRHVRETPTRQFRSIRLNEYLLLLLRMIILTLLVMFMSGWYLENLKDHTQWLVIEPGLEAEPALQPLLDSLDAAGYEKRWLLADFPSVDGQRPRSSLDYILRLDELGRLPVEEVLILASNRLPGFRGPRISLPENVKWIDVELPGRTEDVARIQVKPDSLYAREGRFTRESLEFVSHRTLGTGGHVPDTVQVVLAYDNGFDTDRNTLAAVLQVIKVRVPHVLLVSEVSVAGFQSAANADWLFWLSESQPPQTNAALVKIDERGGANILERVGPQKFSLTSRLNSETAVNKNLALHLVRLLFDNAAMQAVVDSLDRRTIPNKAAFKSKSGDVRASVLETGNKASTEYLAGALLFFLVLERIVANRRKQ